MQPRTELIAVFVSQIMSNSVSEKCSQSGEINIQKQRFADGEAGRIKETCMIDGFSG